MLGVPYDVLDDAFEDPYDMFGIGGFGDPYDMFDDGYVGVLHGMPGLLYMVDTPSRTHFLTRFGAYKHDDEDPDIVKAAGRGDLAAVKRIIANSMTAAAHEEGGSDSSSECSCDELGSHEDDESEGLSDATDDFLEQDGASELGSRWDPVREGKNSKQLCCIRLVESTVDILGGIVEVNMRELREGLLSEGITMREAERALGMKLKDFLQDRRKRADKFGLDDFVDCRSLRRKMKMAWTRKQARQETAAAAPGVASATEAEAAAEMREAKTAEKQRRRIALVVNAAKRWTEVTEKWGLEKSWEWFGDTPLIAASRNGHPEVVRYLLLELADPTLESCPQEDKYEDAMKAAAQSLRRLGCTLSDSRAGIGQQLACRLLQTAMGYWSEAPYKSPAYGKKRRAKMRNEPRDKEGLRAAMEATAFSEEELAAVAAQHAPPRAHGKGAGVGKGRCRAPEQRHRRSEVVFEGIKGGRKGRAATGPGKGGKGKGKGPQSTGQLLCVCGRPAASACTQRRCNLCCSGPCPRHAD
mmetsp:Transcript_106264/g.310674  ORF Transcript_106264/g.310674 Transcript_106264/m.310674 type:complete len:526 (+) Transcript_106264:76-1653(+)